MSRYPDLIVHRLIHSYLAAKPTADEKRKIAGKLPDIAEHASKMERRAIDAERETDALKKAEYMLDKIGEQFEGIISSVTSFGIFVQLENTVEGLISLQELKDDYYRYDQQHLIIIGENTNNIYRIGQKVLIEVERVSVEDREIDFKLIETYPTDNRDLEHVVTSNKERKARKDRKPGPKSKSRQTFKKVAKQSSRKDNKKGNKFQIRKRKK